MSREGMTLNDLVQEKSRRLGNRSFVDEKSYEKKKALLFLNEIFLSSFNLRICGESVVI